MSKSRRISKEDKVAIVKRCLSGEFQYTNRTFYNKLTKAKMKQSMSRVTKCIDNGPMEGFWGILKRERYYGKRFILNFN